MGFPRAFAGGSKVGEQTHGLLPSMRYDTYVLKQSLLYNHLPYNAGHMN
jgi:hypothetical protein